jgi:hypothetical protein
MSFVNSSAASGGAESETIEHARTYGPLSLTTVEKTVNAQDFVVLLQEMSTLLNAIAYGKGNEPAAVYTDFGYYIPPYDVWIYPVYDKTGWENFPTYSYPVEMKIGRPWNTYGYLAKENIIFDDDSKVLTKLKYYAHDSDTSNIKVSDFYNNTIYSPTTDYVIDQEGRTITRLTTGTIAADDLVAVQYYENDEMDDTSVQINFATSDTQPISKIPIYPDATTSAISLDLQTTLVENTVSSSDYNWPDEDYYIDYSAGTITKNSAQPYIDSKVTFGTSKNITSGTNNKFILNINGLNAEIFNVDHDITIDCLKNWASIGYGVSPVTYLATGYSFKISIDGAPAVEYGITMGAPSTWTIPELAQEIWDNAADITDASNHFHDSGAIVFADYYRYPGSPILTFMTTTSTTTSSIALSNGGNGGYTNLFSLTNIIYPTEYDSDTKEVVSAMDIAFRLRCAFNSLGLCYGYVGQSLPAATEERPEIYSKYNLLTPSSFTITGATNDSLTFEIAGTAGATYDGTQVITLTTLVAHGSYDLTTYNGRLDLIEDLQTDIDNAIGHDNVIQAFWLRIDGAYYRVGFRIYDVGSTTISPFIKMLDDIGRVKFQFAENQKSTDGNLLEAYISPDSNMVSDIFLRIHLQGAYGSTAYLQIKANDSIHNNTITLLGVADDQYKYGSSIASMALIGDKNLIESSLNSLTYTIVGSGPTQNDRFNLTITSGPTGITDGDYVVTIPAATYNINQLIDAINLAFSTADYSGTPTNLSTFLVCEKVEGQQRIRFMMTDFDSTAVDAPDVEINDNDDATINKLCIDAMGFSLSQKMSTASTIILHYGGDWNSDYDSDTSEATSIIKNLEDNRLISQDYIIKDPTFTSFDVKGEVYVAKGFDRTVVETEAEAAVLAAYRIDAREFQSPAAITHITDLIGAVEGVDYLDIEYFGKDYQLYKSYVDSDKYASVTGSKPAEDVVARWSSLASFKITLDGCTVSNVNYDGEYLIKVGNGWTDRDYDSLIDSINDGVGATGGFKHATPLKMGGIETDLTAAVQAKHNSGIVTIYTTNEGEHVSLKVEAPDTIFTYGYQTLGVTTDISEASYAPSSVYSLKISVDGSTAYEFIVNSQSSGEWKITDIADQINSATIGLPEISKAITVADVAGSLNNKYFTFFDGVSDQYYIWYNVSGGGTDPAPAGTGIEVAISTGATADTVATETASAVLTAAPDNFNLVVATGQPTWLTITNVDDLSVTDISSGTSGFSVSVTQQGRNPSVALASLGVCGIDDSGKIRITSNLGGRSSTVAITAGTAGTNLLTLIGPADAAVQGTAGWISCLLPTTGRSNSYYAIPSDAALHITPKTSIGLVDYPPITDTEAYNLMTKITSDYDEILVLSDDYFISGSTALVDQRHGLILEYLESTV